MESLRHRVRQSRTAWDRQTAVLLGNWQRAGADFVAAAGQASSSFGRFVSRESAEWRSFVEGVVRELPARLSPAAVQQLERELWLQLTRLLDAAQGSVQARLRQLTGPAGGEGSLPITDYDQLTARQVVARVAELSARDCRRIRDYEARHKQRSTVLRVLDQRLAN